MAMPRLIDILVFNGWSGVQEFRTALADRKRYGHRPVQAIADRLVWEDYDASPESDILEWVVGQLKERQLGNDIELTHELLRRLAAESPNGPTHLDPFGLLRDYVRGSKPDKKHGGGVCLIKTWIDNTPAAIVFECLGDRSGIRVVVLRAFRYLIFKWFGLLPREPERESVAAV